MWALYTKKQCFCLHKILQKLFWQWLNVWLKIADAHAQCQKVLYLSEFMTPFSMTFTVQKKLMRFDGYPMTSSKLVKGLHANRFGTYFHIYTKLSFIWPTWWYDSLYRWRPFANCMCATVSSTLRRHAIKMQEQDSILLHHYNVCTTLQICLPFRVITYLNKKNSVTEVTNKDTVLPVAQSVISHRVFSVGIKVCPKFPNPGSRYWEISLVLQSLRHTMIQVTTIRMPQTVKCVSTYAMHW